MKRKALKTVLAGVSLSAALAMGGAAVQAEETTETVETEVAETEAAETEAAEEEDYTTGDASLDNIRNQDEIGEKELLVMSFGTSFNDSRRLTIGAIEDAIEKALPDWSVRRGFTANIVIDHIESRDGYHIDDINEALDRAVDNGVKNLVVQPTHLMNGIEYEEVTGKLAEYADSFEKVAIGEPLLTSDEDFDIVADAIAEATAEYDDGETAICFMGHGTEHEANAVYQKMQDVLTEKGKTNYFVGTVEGSPTLDDVLAAVQAGEYKKVVLRPLMVVAGDHANNDMAGDEEGTWKNVFEEAGYEVESVLEGLGQIPAIQDLYVAHAQAAVDSLAE
ncbi:MAG: sirohydrochlorin cobaltochelatase [Marvinbryantia sp.]